ncbi:MAG: glycosyltransferase family 2 protein [Candidatus Woesearchaeota archaeon]
MRDVSVGIIAHNEESNIRRLIDSVLDQETTNFALKEIIVVSSGSTDKTNEIVSGSENKDSRVRLVTETHRQGKYSAINIFLKNAQSDILVMISGDVVPKTNSIEKLCMPLLKKKVGLSGGHPIPVDCKDNFLGYCIWLEWKLHHLISLENPKFGEMIAFKKVFSEIPPTSVDEEEIARIVKEKGLKGVYVPSAIVYNRGPENLLDFIEQRRRIYAGHIALRKKGYIVATTEKLSILKKIMNLPNQRFFWTIGVVFVELYSRFLGLIDNFILKKDHFVWKILAKDKGKKAEFQDIIIIIPTLNEEENIGELINLLTGMYPAIKILVVDDDSKDKTKEIVKAHSYKNKNIRLMVRKNSDVKGLTASLIDGIKAVNTIYLIVMDGDLQHPPEKIEEIRGVLANCDVVVGKRDKVLKWSFKRRLMSFVANLLAHIRLFNKKNRCHDLMSGYFGGKTELFKTIVDNHEDEFVKEGYKFLFEFFKFNRKNLKIKEFSYDFGMRMKGNSKIGKKEIKAFIRSLFR